MTRNLSRVLGEEPGSTLLDAAVREACRSYALYWFETFHLRGTDEPPYPGTGNFCTTDGKSYDVVVTAILIAVAVRAEGSVRSDGRWDDWAAGVARSRKRCDR